MPKVFQVQFLCSGGAYKFTNACHSCFYIQFLQPPWHKGYIKRPQVVWGDGLLSTMHSVTFKLSCQYQQKVLNCCSNNEFSTAIHTHITTKIRRTLFSIKKAGLAISHSLISVSPLRCKNVFMHSIAKNCWQLLNKGRIQYRFDVPFHYKGE